MVKAAFSTWTWRCPHCLSEQLPLRQALDHMGIHYGCWGCQIETMVCLAMLQGRGVLVDPIFRRPSARRFEDVVRHARYNRFSAGSDDPEPAKDGPDQ